MQNKFIKSTASILLTLTASAAILTSYSNVALAKRDDRVYVEIEDECNDESSTSDTSSEDKPSEPGASDADWLTKGSEANKVAQAVFDILTKEYGTSGSFAAGAMANIAGESGFIPDISQGGTRFGMNSKTPPANEGGGGGLVQFTPYTKFTNSQFWGKGQGSDGWAVENQMAALWFMEFQNKAVWTYALANQGRYGANHGFASLEDWLSTDDAVKASIAFQVGYERPAAYHPERETWARSAETMFNKDKVKSDKNKWQLDGSGGSNDASGSSSSDSESKSKTNKCTLTEKTKSGGTGWQEKGGKPSTTQGVWKPADLPDDLKEYAIDPESMGMKLNSSSGWQVSASGAWNQCTDLSSSLMYALWEKDGNHPRQARGNGTDVAANWASAFGGSTSKTPVSGAVFSMHEGQYGHTGVVSHVFENDDILVIEQNYSKISGEQAGMTYSWNYRYVSTSQYSDWDFYNPGDNGHKISSDAKSL